MIFLQTLTNDGLGERVVNDRFESDYATDSLSMVTPVEQCVFNRSLFLNCVHSLEGCGSGCSGGVVLERREKKGTCCYNWAKFVEPVSPTRHYNPGSPCAKCGQ